MMDTLKILVQQICLSLIALAGYVKVAPLDKRRLVFPLEVPMRGLYAPAVRKVNLVAGQADYLADNAFPVAQCCPNGLVVGNLVGTLR